MSVLADSIERRPGARLGVAPQYVSNSSSLNAATPLVQDKHIWLGVQTCKILA